jgi:hypothetical protein
MTDRRIRYAYSSRLDDASCVFFKKSGNYYSGGSGKYAGYEIPIIWLSVILVEHPDGTEYIVCLMSKYFGKNPLGSHVVLRVPSIKQLGKKARR